MVLTRRFRIVAAVLVLGGLVAGTAAVAGMTGDEPEASGSASPAADSTLTAPTADAAEPDTAATDRAVPAEAAEPVPVDPQVQAQVSYMIAHWTDYNTDAYGVIADNDCVNFTSQSLIERGWTMDDQWYAEGTGSDFVTSSPWISSTAFRDYVAQSGRATALTDDQRDQVKIGDVAQFDWDNSGDRDHTGVVTRIEGSGDDIQIYYAGHTDDTDFRSVDYAITEKHPGATAYYWSIP